MYKKIKFKPEITRIRLNPEQAVLQCNCFDTSRVWVGPSGRKNCFDLFPYDSADCTQFRGSRDTCNTALLMHNNICSSGRSRFCNAPWDQSSDKWYCSNTGSS